MLKWIAKLFGYKLLTTEKYENILTRIAVCGNIYRKYSTPGYSNYGEQFTVEASELSEIALVENEVWDDIKHKLVNYRFNKNTGKNEPNV